mgnify:CR=1 FL=1
MFVTKVIQIAKKIEVITQTDFHKILEFTSSWPSLYLLAKIYVPNYNGESVAPNGVNVVKVNIGSEKEP